MGHTCANVTPCHTHSCVSITPHGRGKQKIPMGPHPEGLCEPLEGRHGEELQEASEDIGFGFWQMVLAAWCRSGGCGQGMDDLEAVSGTSLETVVF